MAKSFGKPTGMSGKAFGASRGKPATMTGRAFGAQTSAAHKPAAFKKGGPVKAKKGK